MTSSSRLVGIALAVIAVLAGCGGDDDGGSPTLPPVLPVATTGSPVGTPSASAPADRSASASSGPGAKAAETAAVEAAVRYYFDGFRRAYDAGDASEAAEGSLASCPCRRVVPVVQQLLDIGDVSGGKVVIEALQVGNIEDGRAVVTVTTTDPGGSVKAASGEVQEFRGEGRTRKAVILVKQRGIWLVATLTALP